MQKMVSSPAGLLPRIAVGLMVTFSVSPVQGQEDATDEFSLDGPVAVETAERPAGENETRSYKDRIRDAYGLAKRAKSIEQFTHAIAQCEVVLNRDSLPDAHRKYAETLASWIYNKRGEAYSAQAEELHADGDREAERALERNALQDFMEAVRLNRRSWRPRHNRGVSYAILQQFDKAIVDFTAATKLNPRFKDTWFNRAEVHYELGEFQKAADDYTQCLRLDPRDPDAYSSRGHAYFHLGKYVRSVRDYDKVLQLNPEDALAYIDRADAYVNLAEWSKAAADYRISISLDNRQPRAYQHAAWLMATCPQSEFRNPELAVRAAERAIELAGESDHRSLDTLAAAHACAGEFGEARKVIQQAIHLAPENQAGPLETRWQLYQQEQPFLQETRQPKPSNVLPKNR